MGRLGYQHSDHELVNVSPVPWQFVTGGRVFQSIDVSQFVVLGISKLVDVCISFVFAIVIGKFVSVVFRVCKSVFDTIQQPFDITVEQPLTVQ